jgi:hypothetical protein
MGPGAPGAPPRFPSIASAALVGAAIISTLVFPLLGLRLRRDRPKEPEQPANPTPEPAAAQA